MDSESIFQFLGKKVSLTLANNFWYRAVITNVSDNSVEFTEEKGRKLSVSPNFILFISEVGK